MTYFAVEKALWGIAQDPASASAFIDNAEAYLTGFNLTDTERLAIQTFDLRLLADTGVNPLLLMQSWNAVQGPDRIGEYLGRMNAS